MCSFKDVWVDYEVEESEIKQLAARIHSYQRTPKEQEKKNRNLNGLQSKNEFQ